MLCCLCRDRYYHILHPPFWRWLSPSSTVATPSWEFQHRRQVRIESLEGARKAVKRKRETWRKGPTRRNWRTCLLWSGISFCCTHQATASQAYLNTEKGNCFTDFESMERKVRMYSDLGAYVIRYEARCAYVQGYIVGVFCMQRGSICLETLQG